MNAPESKGLCYKFIIEPHVHWLCRLCPFLLVPFHKLLPLRVKPEGNSMHSNLWNLFVLHVCLWEDNMQLLIWESLHPVLK